MKKLERNEMKHLNGGTAGTCRGWVESDGVRYYTYSQMTQTQAQDYADTRAVLIGDEGAWGGQTISRAGWCCASCP